MCIRIGCTLQLVLARTLGGDFWKQRKPEGEIKSNQFYLFLSLLLRSTKILRALKILHSLHRLMFFSIFFFSFADKEKIETDTNECLLKYTLVKMIISYRNLHALSSLPPYKKKKERKKKILDEGFFFPV